MKTTYLDGDVLVKAYGDFPKKQLDVLADDFTRAWRGRDINRNSYIVVVRKGDERQDIKLTIRRPKSMNKVNKLFEKTVEALAKEEIGLYDLKICEILGCA